MADTSDRRQLAFQITITRRFRETIDLYVLLDITSAEVATLTADEAEALRELGATDAMLAQLRELAQTPDRHFALDFARQAVLTYATADAPYPEGYER